MKCRSIAVTAGALLLGTATLASAQDRERGGPPMGAGPERGLPQAGPERGNAPQMREPRAAPQERPGRGVEERGAVERQPPKGRAEQPNVRERSAEQERARQRSEDQRNAAQRGAREQQDRERATRKRGRGEGQTDEAARNRGERPSAQIAERRERIHQTRERLAPDQRQLFRRDFDFRTARVTNARFDARIGTRVPRHVRLFAVPRAIITLVPDYTYYRYVVLDDRICIIDPDTYEIVDVIDEGYYAVGRPQVATLDLTSSERALVLDSISPDFPQADVRLRLALGGEIPARIEIHRFPDVVLDRIPKLRDFGFIVAQDTVVIADPRDHAIVAVLER